MRTTLIAATTAVVLLTAACGGSSLPSETTETSTSSSSVVSATTSTRPGTAPGQGAVADGTGTTVPQVTASATTVPQVKNSVNGNILNGLRVAAENCSGYSRDHYRPHGSSWKQLGGVGYLSNETLSSGDVDHVVSLHEAWCSGIRDPKFGSDGFNHRASKSGVNRGKGQHDPREWWDTSGSTTPRTGDYPGWCDYLLLHVEVKLRWDGTVDQAEHDFLVTHLSNCGHTANGTNQTTDTPTSTTTMSVTTTRAATTKPSKTCTHDGRGHGFLGYNPRKHTHPTDHTHKSGKCAGV